MFATENRELAKTIYLGCRKGFMGSGVTHGKSKCESVISLKNNSDITFMRKEKYHLSFIQYNAFIHIHTNTCTLLGFSPLFQCVGE